jgi:hypothetical protein
MFEIKKFKNELDLTFVTNFTWFIVLIYTKKGNIHGNLVKLH